MPLGRIMTFSLGFEQILVQSLVFLCQFLDPSCPFQLQLISVQLLLFHLIFGFKGRYFLLVFAYVNGFFIRYFLLLFYFLDDSFFQFAIFHAFFLKPFVQLSNLTIVLIDFWFYLYNLVLDLVVFRLLDWGRSCGWSLVKIVHCGEKRPRILKFILNSLS